MGKYTTLDFLKSQWEPLSFESQDLSGKVIIVTGANAGIGYETAKALAKMKPARLILACRNAGKAKEAASEIKTATGFQDIEPWDLDLASFASVRAFARRFDESGLQLHILINNAGVANFSYTRTGDGFETTLQVNHLSTMLLTLLLLPAIRRTAASSTWAPRIVVLTSETHYWAALPEHTTSNLLTVLNDHMTFNAGTQYPITKLFNVLFVQELARRLARSSLPQDHSIVVSSVNPGLTSTELSGSNLRVKTMMFLLGRSAEKGASTSIYVATAPEVAKLTPYGRYYTNCRAEEAADLTLGAEGEELAAKLWSESLEIIGVTDAEVKL